MRKHHHFNSRIRSSVYGFIACCLLLLAGNSQAQKKNANWLDWKIDYKGQMSKEEKAKLQDNITAYVKDWLVSQKKPELAKGLKLNFTESANSFIINDGSAVAIGSLAKGPPPPPPPIIPNDKLKTMNPKMNAIKVMH